jgi:hypothetical protein
VISGVGIMFLGIWLWALEGPGGYMLKTPSDPLGTNASATAATSAH